MAVVLANMNDRQQDRFKLSFRSSRNKRLDFITFIIIYTEISEERSTALPPDALYHQAERGLREVPEQFCLALEHVEATLSRFQEHVSMMTVGLSMKKKQDASQYPRIAMLQAEES
jgi:hypothetical protein